jgi:type VI secretion system protein ImpG
MINRYYQQELSHLRDLAVQFSKAHPVLAPMLSGPTTDPDVERLLEGVAFLTALLRQKLDDEFPEIVHELIRLIWPHYLRTIPSSTIVAFTPKPTLKESIRLPSGVQVGSIAVEGTSCLFRTCYEVDLHPLSLIDTILEQKPGSLPAIRLVFQVNGIRLSEWRPHSLRLFLAGDYPTACDTYLLLRNHLRRIVLSAHDGGIPLVLGPDSLKPVGFSDRETMIPYPSHSFPGYRILQEYFILPEKFLFLDLDGWDRWTDRGDGSKFEVLLELDSLPVVPRIRTENFVLSATPAVNIFPHDAEPIRLDHRRTEYLVRPTGGNFEHFQVHSVEKVTGFVQGTAEERKYQSFDFFNPDVQSHPVYRTIHRRSPLGDWLEIWLAVAYPPEAGLPVLETLSIDLLCTNGMLPEQLRVGDICRHTATSPEYAEFKNILPPKVHMLPPVGANLLWRMLSHLSLNYLSLERAENLRALLELYLFTSSRDRPAFHANQKRIASIRTVQNRGTDRLVSGVLMRGQEIRLKVLEDHFASRGDLFLFGSVLDCFLAAYSSINTFTQLLVEEAARGEVYKWPAKIGDRPLI